MEDKAGYRLLSPELFISDGGQSLLLLLPARSAGCFDYCTAVRSKLSSATVSQHPPVQRFAEKTRFVPASRRDGRFHRVIVLARFDLGVRPFRRFSELYDRP